MFIRGLIAEELLSKQFTELDSTKKDVTQRAYAMANELILFLVDPIAEVRKVTSIANHNKRMEANRKG